MHNKISDVILHLPLHRDGRVKKSEYYNSVTPSGTPFFGKIAKNMLVILSIQTFSLSDPGILFLDELGNGIIQTPTKNYNNKLKKMQKIFEDLSKKL